VPVILGFLKTCCCLLWNHILPIIILFFKNCSIHTAHRVAAWIQDRNVNVLEWPSRSPDLNSIENTWGLLVKKLKAQRRIFRNREELLTAITEAWIALPPNYHRNLCLSMRNRLLLVVQQNGAIIKY
jgi:transposase